MAMAEGTGKQRWGQLYRLLFSELTAMSLCPPCARQLGVSRQFAM